MGRRYPQANNRPDKSREDLSARGLEERGIGYRVLRLGKRNERGGYLIRKMREKGVDKARGRSRAMAGTAVMGVVVLLGLMAVLMILIPLIVLILQGSHLMMVALLVRARLVRAGGAG